MDDARLERLIADYYSGDLHDADRAELETALRESASARERLVEAAFDEVALAELVGHGVPVVPASGQRRGFRRGWFGVAIAAAILLGLSTWWVLLEIQDSSKPRWIELKRGRCSAVESEGELRRVDRLESGRPYVSDSEVALNLEGTRIELARAVAFQVTPAGPDGRATFELFEGRARFDVPSDAKGLRVRTPVGELKDIGTEFEVTVQREEASMRRESSLAALVLATVFSGRVEFAPEHGGSVQELRPGNGTLELRDDGRIGKVVDREGIGQVRPVGASRWTVARAEQPLDPGDWLQTGARGAHALVVRLANGTRITLGPHTQLELKDVARGRLYGGEAEIVCPDSVTFELSGADDQRLDLKGTAVVAIRDGDLRRLTEPPRWLIGYRSDDSTDALGSLLATVDGRNVPLTIGYHKVSVDIRDQIARTTIEESFVNHTGTVLEGVFYFPLPEDASISGFAMWINGERVDADVVEKERAREIYETILREKRDPGLLEWTGGNIFKARVYPIGAEKRIQIRYTQVLPKVKDTYRYHYALRSELTRSHPLERLELEVTIASEDTLAEVTCPTHPARIRTTPGGARVEYSAQQVVPERDFELAVRTEPQAQAVRIIPHRRTLDGYFLMTIDAPQLPSSEPSGSTEPLDCLLVADTSGSMAGPAREAQIAFIEAFLASLSETDRFNLATSDVSVRWAFDRAVACTADNRRHALNFLTDRRPLGWSDLDAAFESAFGRAREKSQIVYVGDGVGTKGKIEGADLVRRVTAAHGGRGAVHAVAVSSAFDALVLRGLSRLGAGSWRSLSAGTDAAVGATALLAELTTPSVRDLEITFEGIEVAAVYPEVLPSLVAGTQQIVVGRFDPRSLGDSTGRVRVRGRFGDEAIDFEAPIDLTEADRSNSFIPRLWARHHLDHLLEQGDAAENRERIIALSEDFQIITPFTSFLVLESEADRRRFRVERQFHMRDGEEFFTEGRDSADFELRNAQKQLATRWRFEARQREITALRGLGSDWMELLRSSGWDDTSVTTFGLNERAVYGGRAGVGGGGGFDGGRRLGRDRIVTRSAGEYARNYDVEAGMQSGAKSEAFWDESRLKSFEWSANAFEPVGQDADNRLPERLRRVDDLNGYRGPSDTVFFAKRYAPPGLAGPSSPGPGRFLRPSSALKQDYKKSGALSLSLSSSSIGSPALVAFPTVSEPPVRKELPPSWSEDLRRRLTALDRRDWVLSQSGGLRFRQTTRNRDARGRIDSDHERHALLSGSSWWTDTLHTGGSDIRFDWVHGDERGALQEMWRFASTRPRQPGDELAWSAPIPFLFGDLTERFGQRAGHPESTESWTIRVEPGNELTTLVLLPSNTDSGYREEIDLSADGLTVLAQRRYTDDALTWRVEYDEFFEAAGQRWPGRLRSFDADGEWRSEIRYEVEALSADAFRVALESELARSDDAITLGPEQPAIGEARAHLAAGNASLTDVLIVLGDLAASQRWERADVALDALRRLIAGRRGAQRLQLSVEMLRRRNAEALQIAQALAEELVTSPRTADRAAAADLPFAGFTAPAERLALIETLQPVYARQPGLAPLRNFDQQLLSVFEQLGWTDRALEKQRELATTYPWESGLHYTLAVRLAQRGEIAEALATLERAEADAGPWTDAERYVLRTARLEVLLTGYRLDDVVREGEALMRELPDSVDTWMPNRHLSALIMLDRTGPAEDAIERWIRAGLTAGPKDKLAHNLLQAAVTQALGSGWNMYRSRFDERFGPVVREAALASLWDDRLGREVLSSVLSNWSFRRGQTGQDLAAELYRELVAGLDARSAEHLARLAQLLHASQSYVPGDEEPTWASVYDRLLSRWESADRAGRRAVEQLLTSHADSELKQKLWRRVIELEEDAARVILARRSLFDLLIEETWSPTIEDELFQLIPRLALWNDALVAVDREASLAIFLDAMHRLASGLPAARARAELNADPESSSWTRRELKARWDELSEAARTALSDRLRALESRFEPALARPWMRLERWALQVSAPADAAATASEAIAALKEIWPTEPPDLYAPSAVRERVRIERTLAIATYFAAVAGPDSEPSRSLETFLIERDDASAALAGRVDARAARYRLLLTLNLDDKLTEALRSWYANGERFDGLPWGRLLSRLLVEDGELEKAIEILDTVEARDELAPEDYRLLAGWRVALADRVGERTALLKFYASRDEWTLRRELQGELPHYQRSGDGVPEELDATIPLRLEAIFSQATNPQQHVWALRQYYQATKDHRLLTAVARGVTGATPMSVYSFLDQFRQVLDLIHDEAVLDLLLDEVDALTVEATSIDQRALQLLTIVTSWRGTQQASGTEEFAERLRQSMSTAMQASWEPSERVAMAQLLATLGTSTKHPELVDTILGHLGEIQSACEVGSTERVRVAVERARLGWSAERREEAVRVLSGAIDGYRALHERRLSVELDGARSNLSSYLCQMGRFTAAEDLWLLERELATQDARRHAAIEGLYGVYQQALRAGGSVSLGSGEGLYEAVRDSLWAALERRSNEDHAERLVTFYSQIAILTHEKIDREQPGRDLLEFAFRRLPRALGLYQHRNVRDAVRQIADALQSVVSAKEALRFLVTRAESEPSWLAWRNMDFWSRDANRFGKLIQDASPEGDLERRALSIVVDELRAALRTRVHRNRRVYHDGDRYFWSAQRGAFLAVALEIAEERADSEPHLVYIAAYLWDSLSERSAAIDVLMRALERRGLDVDARRLLARYLSEDGRWKDARPILARLIVDRPDDIDVRGWWIRAVFHVDGAAAARLALDEAEAHFRAEERWTEAVAAALATTAAEVRLWKPAIALSDEAINLRRRGNDPRGTSDGTLAGYYGIQIEAYSALGQTAPAVDAAAGAILVWSQSRNERQKALERLQRVLATASDLEEYLSGLDREVEKTGLENPIVRRAAGEAYLDRKQFGPAIVQLEKAMEAAPEDVELARRLIAAYDGAGRAEQAAARLWEVASGSRMQFELFLDLGDRWTKLERPEAAERAYTNVVELIPNESEGHALLAGKREQQEHFDQAAHHWREVTRIRSKEPTGYLGLARSLIAGGEGAQAKPILEQLLRQDWPEHFGDVAKDVRELLKRLE